MILTDSRSVMPSAVVAACEEILGFSTAWSEMHSQGTSHQLYQTEGPAGERWVVRLRSYTEPAPGVDPARELAILGQLSTETWIPECRLINAEEGFVLMRWAGTPRPSANWSAVMRASFLEVVAQIHQIDVPHKLDYSVLFDQYRQAFGKQSVGLKQLVDQTEQLISTLPNIGESLVHHDLHGANICWSDRPRIIDWEYAGQGNPWLDYATLVRELRVNETELKTFPKLRSLDQKTLERGLAQAVDCIDQLEQLWLHYRDLTSP